MAADPSGRAPRAHRPPPSGSPDAPHGEAPASPARRARPDPLGLWMCGLAVLGGARAWLYLVRDATPGPYGWMWLGGSLLLAVLGIVLIVRNRRASMVP